MAVPRVLEEAMKGIDERKVAGMEIPEVKRVIGSKIALVLELSEGRSGFRGTSSLYIDPESFNTLIVSRSRLIE